MNTRFDGNDHENGRQLAGQEQHLDGQLRISSSDWFGSHVLAPTVADFNLRHPRVAVELLTDARTYSLARREADIAFRNIPFEEPEVISRRFMTLDYSLYMRSGTKQPEVGDGTGSTLVTMDIAFGGMPGCGLAETCPAKCSCGIAQ